MELLDSKSAVLANPTEEPQAKKQKILKLEVFAPAESNVDSKTAGIGSRSKEAATIQQGLEI